MEVDFVATPIDILLVEDSRGDVRLIREALKNEHVDHVLHVAPDGDEAMAFLRREGGYTAAPRPDIVLLDLNLPRKNGRAVLREIKDSAEFRRIPVIVLTTSSSDEDVVACYDMHANCYITKPMGMEPINKLIREIRDYWFSTVRLPRMGTNP